MKWKTAGYIHNKVNQLRCPSFILFQFLFLKLRLYSRECKGLLILTRKHAEGANFNLPTLSQAGGGPVQDNMAAIQDVKRLCEWWLELTTHLGRTPSARVSCWLWPSLQASQCGPLSPLGLAASARWIKTIMFNEENWKVSSGTVRNDIPWAVDAAVNVIWISFTFISLVGKPWCYS